LYLEITVVKIEVIRVLVEKERENTLLKSVGPLIGATVHEKILASGVTMDITIEKNVTTF
jgi:hypothetical protein